MTTITLSILRARLERLLDDLAHDVWTTTVLEDAIRTALEEYSNACPCAKESYIVAPGAGREIALDELDNLMSISRVWWPYDSLSTTWPPNRVRGFELYFDDNRPILFLTDLNGAEPAANDEIRIWYTVPRQISELDEAAATTVPNHHIQLLQMGASGYAAMFAASNLLTERDAEALRKWAYARMADFRLRLDQLRGTEVRMRGEPYGRGWSLDKWDESS